MSRLLTIIVKVQPPQRAELSPWVFCIIKWVCLESKMFFFFFFLVGLTHTLFPTARDKVGVDSDMIKWLYLCCKRSAGWLRETYKHLLSLCLTTFLYFHFLHAHTQDKKVCDCVSLPQHRERKCISKSSCGWKKNVWRKKCGHLHAEKFAPGRFYVHCHSWRSNFWGQRLFCHRVPFTSADKLWLLSLWTVSLKIQSLKVWGQHHSSHFFPIFARLKHSLHCDMSTS